MSERVFRADLRRMLQQSALVAVAYGVPFFALGWDMGRFAAICAVGLLSAGLISASQSVRVRAGEVHGHGMWNRGVHFPLDEVDLRRSLVRRRSWSIQSSRSILSRGGQRITVPPLSPAAERELLELLQVPAAVDRLRPPPSGPPVPWILP